MKVIVQKLATEYLDEGEGDTILLLHGWQDNLHTFDKITASLKETNRVVRLDLPGFGNSEAPQEAWSVTDYVRFVDDFTKKIDLSVDVLVGHSLGGRIVIKSEAKKIIDCKKIVLIASAGIGKTKTPRNKMFGFLVKGFGWITYLPPLLFYRKEIRRKIYKIIGSDYLDSGNLKETYLKVINEDLTSNMKEIKKETLLIWGEDDTETPLSDGEKINKLIEDSQLKVFSNAGHFVHRERPGEVLRVIKNFL